MKIGKKPDWMTGDSWGHEHLDSKYDWVGYVSLVLLAFLLGLAFGGFYLGD